MFASMLEAADYCMVLAYPETAASPFAGVMLLVPRAAEGRRVNANWDTLGMRATRSDALILDECWVPESALVFESDDIRPFRHAHLNWFWGSYTAVYLGVAAAAYREAVRVMKTRQPEGYAQPLAYQPDVRRHVAQMSADLEAARLVTYQVGLAQRHRGADAANDGRPLPREICRRRGRDPHYPHGADPVRRARHLQRLAPRAAVPRRRDRDGAAAASRIFAC